jgi:DUF4097 and DUF4098 domain-containing protein YvlB
MERILPDIKFLLLLLFLGTIVAFSQTLEEVFTRTIPFKSEGLISLENMNGNIEIEGWDKEEFYLEAEKRVKADNHRDAEEVMAQVEIVVDEGVDEISIRTRVPQKSGGFWDWIFGDHISVSINYMLRLPQKCHLRIDNTNGSIEIENVEGVIHLETTNGKIRAREIGGKVEAFTTNGSIRSDITAIAADGDIQLTTTNGNIQISLSPNAAFDLRARTTNGTINTDFPVNISGKFIGSRVSGLVNGGGPLVYLETTNGNIDVEER